MQSDTTHRVRVAARWRRPPRPRRPACSGAVERLAGPRAQLPVAADAGRGDDRPATWAGSIPQVNGIAPRVRIGRSRWFNLLWLLPIGFVLLLVAVAVAKGLRDMPAVQRFIARYPGTIEPSHPDATTGFPAWVGWQHFLNLFFLIFIIRSGLQILTDHPRLYWTRHSHARARTGSASRSRCPTDPLWTAKQDSISLPRQVGLPGPAPLDRPGPLVASRRRHAVAAQRRGLLRPAVRDRPVAAARADQLGRASRTRCRC